MKSEKRKALERLRAALAEYDAHAEVLEGITTQEEMDAWTDKEAILSLRCGEAFADFTEGVNSRETALSVRPCYWTKDDFLHRLVEETDKAKFRPAKKVTVS